MSRVIDERVVSMQFDNKQFESNVHTSLSTIDKLKQSLNFKGIDKSFASIDAASKKCNLSPISTAVDSVKVKFSALEIMAVTALSNITNSAINSGKRIVSSLTIDPVKMGFKEYETQINAVQTILANTESKGTTLGDVNSALDELNKYADMTIYNFTEMTKNIGTFTAAGVDLDTSVAAIKGIANLAAVSGSTSQQAATAMYQLSQALSSGTVKLMDWNSVVNAGMGGQVFQDALKETARVHGIAIDDMIKKEGSFRETLQNGWLSSEILLETLKKFTGDLNEEQLKTMGYTEEQIAGIMKLGQTANDAATKVKTFTQLYDTLQEAAQSGWTQTWEYIFGDFEQTKYFFSGLSDVIGDFINKSAESRNSLLGEAMTSNYDKLITKINEAGIETSDFESKIKDVLKKHGYDVDLLIQKYGTLGNAFSHSAIPAATLKEVLAGLGTTADFSFDKITRTLKKGLSGDDVKQAQKALKTLGYDLGAFGENADGVDGILGSMTESAIKAFQAANGLEANGIIGPETLSALEKAAGNTKKLTGNFTELIDEVGKLGGGELLREGLTNLVKGVINILSPIKEAWGEVFSLDADQVYGILEKFHGVSEKFLKWTEDNSNKIKNIFKGIYSIFGFGLDIVKAVGAGIWKSISPAFSGIATKVISASGSLGEWIENLRTSWLESDKLANITETVAGFIDKVKTIVWSFGKPIWEWIFGSDSDAEGKLTGLQEFIGEVGDFFDRAKNFIKESDAFKMVSNKLSEFRDNITNFFYQFKKEDGSYDIGAMFTSIKDNIIETFKNINIRDIFNKIGTFFTNFGTKFKEDLLDIGIDIDAIKAGIQTNFWEIFNKVAAFFTNFDFKNVWNSIKTFFSNFWSKAASGLNENGVNVTNIKDDIISKIKEIFDNVSEFFKNFDIRETLSNISEFFSELWTNIEVWFSNKGIDLGPLKEKFTWLMDTIKQLIPVIALVGSTIWIFKKASNFFGVVKSFTEPLEDLSKYLQAKAFNEKMEGIRHIAEAIAILAGALTALTLLDQNKLWSAVGAISVITIVVLGMTTLLTKVGNTEGLGGMSLLILELSGAFFLLGLAAKVLASIDNGDLVKAGISISAFLGMMALMMIATKHISKDGKAMHSFGLMAAEIGGALLLFAVSAKILGSMDSGQLIKAGAAIIGFIGIITVMMLATKMLGKYSMSANKVGSMMLSFAGSIILMAFAVKMLASMDSDTFLKGAIRVGIFLAAFVGLMAATKLLSKDAASAGKVGLMLLSFSASLLLIAGAMSVLAMIDAKNLAKATIAISAVGAIMALLIYSTKSAHAKQLGTIIGLSLAIVAMAGALVALSFIPIKNLIAAAGSLGIVMASFSLMLKSISKNINAKSLVAIGILALVVGGLARILYLLQDLPADTTAAVGGALSAMILSLSASCVLLSKVGNNWKNALKGVGVLSVLIAALVGLTYGASYTLPKIGQNLSDFMDKLSGFISGASNINGGMIRNVKILAESILLLSEAGLVDAVSSSIFRRNSTDSFSKFAEWIKELIDIVVDLGIDLTARGVDIDTDALTSIINCVKSLAEASNLMASTTIAFGGFGGKGFGGGGVYIDIPNIEAFTSFIVKVLPILQGFSIAVGGKDVNINTEVINSVINGVETLAEAAETGSSWITGGIGAIFSKFGTGVGGYASISNIDGFTTFVKDTLDSLKTFIGDLEGKSLGDIPIELINAAFTGIETLANAAKDAPTITVGGGFAKFALGWAIFGGSTWTDLDAFRKYLVGEGTNKGVITAVSEFISSLEPFIGTLKDIDANKIEPIMSGISNVITAISSLASSAKDAPKTTLAGGIGGFFKGIIGVGGGAYYSTQDLDAFRVWLVGNDGMINSLIKFFNELEPFTDKLNSFTADKIESITSGISNLITAISTLASSANAAPTTTTGSIDTWGGGLGVLLRGLFIGGGKLNADFSQTKNLEEFKTWLIGTDGNSGMIGAVEALIETFDDELVASINKLDMDKVTKIVDCVNVLANSATSAPTNAEFHGIGGGGFLNWLSGTFGGGFGKADYVSKTDLEGFTEWITEVSPVLRGFVVDAGGIEIPDSEALDTIMSALNALATAASNIGQDQDTWFNGLALIGGIGAMYGNVHTDAHTDYDGFTTFITDLGGEDGILVKLVQAIKKCKFDGSLDSNDTNKLTALCTALTDIASASKDIPDYTTLVGYLGVFGSYKSAPDFTGFVTFIESLTGTDQNGNDTGIIKLINDANAQITGDLDTSKLEMVCSAVKTLASAAKILPEASWWKEKFSGEADFTGFSSWITTLSETIPAFGLAIQNSGITDEALTKIQSMVSVVKVLAEAGNIISNGFTDVSVFGIADAENGKTPIDYIVDAFIAGAEKLKELSEVDISNMATAGQVANQLANTMAILGGQYNTTLSLFADPSKAETLIDAVEAIATALSSFQTAMVGVDLTILSSSSTAANQIATTFSILQNIEYGSINTASLKIKLSELATAMSDFVTNTSSISGLSDATAKLTMLIDTLTGMAGGNYSGVTSFVEAVNSLGGITETTTLNDDLVNLATSAVSDFVSALNNSSKSINDAGVAMITKFKNAASSSAVKLLVKLAFSSVAASGVKGIKEKYSDMKTAGEYLGAGLVKGISSKEDAVYMAGYKLGKKAVQGERDGQKSASPSKETIKSGKWFGEGLVIGITNMASSVYSSSKSLGETAVHGLSNSISRITDVINSDIDAQPTIRPVLDLSDIRSGAGAIRGMLNMQPSVGMTSNIRAISSMMNNGQNGATNYDVISAINNLGSKLGTPSGDTYHINGVTYDDGSNISDAVKTIVRAARIERRR